MHKTPNRSLRRFLQVLPTIALLAVIVGLSCVAKYRTVRKQQAGVASVPSGAAQDATPKKPDAKTDVKAVGPSAGLEALYQDKLVHKVPVGVDLIIRPTADTLDPNASQPKDCRNPGIVVATYTIDQTPIHIKRTQACSDLSAKHKFTTPGTYIISLEVISSDDEKATASMALVVEDTTAEHPTIGGIFVTAVPLVTQVGKNIKFTAVCDDQQNVTLFWRLGDGSTSQEASFQHEYSKSGVFEVHADCQKDAVTVSGSVTVVILEPDTDNATSATSATTTGDSIIDSGTTGGGSMDGEAGTGGASTAGNGSGTAGTSGDSTNGGDEDPNGVGADGSTDGPGQNPGQNPQQNPGQNPRQNPGQNL